jgi:DNA mismatch endonuclease (patch repair protein)
VNLGQGRIVPYPEPKDEAATKIGKANRRTGTKPEMQLRSALHHRGHRFRKDHLLRVGGVRVRPDVVFTRWRVAVFVDGCFWHSCPEHQHVPKRNLDYWLPKLAANVERDRRVNAALTDEGWFVLRIWEHVDVNAAVELIAGSLGPQRGLLGHKAAGP